ncbi:MAG: hypothetical protein WCG27_13390 [Pseudomonadota bacterium]
MNLKILTDEQLLKDTHAISKEEKHYSTLLLLHLEEIERRKLYCELSYSSLWDYVTLHLGYSRSEANTRISAMRLTRDCPDARQEISQGTLSLTSAGILWGHIKQEEKDTGMKFTLEQKKELVDIAKSKSVVEVEKILNGKKTRTCKYKIEISEKTKMLLEEYKDLKGHHSDEEIIALCLRDRIAAIKNERWHEQLKSPGPTKRPKGIFSQPSRYISAETKRQTLSRAGYQCEHVSHVGQRCQEKRFLEFDHRAPFSFYSSSVPAPSRGLPSP